jgi:glycosyltransferase involved in cell wall biosynthesis
MRILVVTHYQPPHYGGIETVAAAVVERYRRAGHEVLWLSSDLPPTPAAAGCRRVPAWNFLEERLGVPYPIWHTRASGTVRQWVRWCDVVHLHDCLYMGSVLALWHARRFGKPTLLTQHVGPVPYRSAVLRGTQRLAYATLGRWVHQRADQVVFVSRAVLEWFGQSVAYRQAPRFVPNGVDASIFHLGDEGVRRAARERVGLGAESRVVAFVGRFVDKKGVLIVEQVARRRPEWLFVMIGEGPIRPSAWGLPNVLVRPFQLQTVLRDYYWAADVLLLPSTGEGFPLVVMEAMACGTPAIISSETFTAWNDGREYFLVAEPTVSAVMGLLDEPRLMTEVFRQSVSAYASAHWNWDEIAAEYLRMLSGLACRG